MGDRGAWGFAPGFIPHGDPMEMSRCVGKGSEQGSFTCTPFQFRMTVHFVCHSEGLILSIKSNA